MKRKLSLLNIGGGVVAFLAAVAIAVAVNVLVSRVHLRVDLTEDRLYTLSEGTKKILEILPGDVTLKFFFNETDVDVPVFVKNYAKQVEDLLREYALASDGKIKVEKYDPRPDSDAEDWARRYGVAGQAVGFMGPQLYFGLVAVMGDRESVLPVLDPQAGSMLEYNITRAISTVAQPAKPVVGVLSGLPVMGTSLPYPMPGQPPGTDPWFAFRDLQQNYQVRPLPAGGEILPDDLDALILVHPRELSDNLLFAIDQFVLKGGRLMAFLDPLCIVELETDPSSQMRMGDAPSGLTRLLKAWGVEYDPSKVVLDLKASTRLRNPQNNRVEENPMWLSLTRDNLDQEAILTARLGNVLMPCAGAFSVAETNGVEATVLMRTSETAMTIDTMTARFNPDGARRQFVSGGRPLTLALQLHGKLMTAFPDGDPSASATNAPVSIVTPLTESADVSSVILVGDADMLYDRFCVNEINFFGFKGYEPLNNNLAFMANAVEQLAGGAYLAAVRARGQTDRPFEVVMDIQRRAQERYLREEVALQQKLEDTQRRIYELQQAKDQSQQLIMSPEQKREIEKFRQDEYETRRALKLVRRHLREDIEALGMRIKVINILLMPLVVIGVGIGVWLYRRGKR